MQKANTLMLAVDDKATIIKSGKNIVFSELKKGMRISVKYKRHGNRMIAKEIHVLTKRDKESRRKYC